MSADVTFRVADRGDNSEILRLLRENAVGGRYAISLERAPDAFAAVAPRLAHDYVLADSAAAGRPVGVCEQVVRSAFVNGRPERLPYLTALRVSDSHRRRIGILKGGFRTLRTRGRDGDLPFALTSITADNAAARRVLTAGVAGLPTYRPAGGYSTLVMRRRKARCHGAVSVATDGELPELAAFLRRELARFQFTPVWSAEALRSLSADFLIHRTGGEIDGCLSLWDQRAARQVVVRGYPRHVRALRPLINACAPLLRLPRLPALSDAVPQGFLSHLAVAQDEPDRMLALVSAALDLAHRRGLAACSLGLASAHPFREHLLKRVRALEYRTLLYLVHWEEGAAAAAACDDRLPMPDIGLL
jgi:hypothetical protein